MKIKRTLPSISLYSPINRHSFSISQKLEQQKFLYNPITIAMTKHQSSSSKKNKDNLHNVQNRKNESFLQSQHSPERSSSSRKPIFENKSRSQSKSRSSSPIQRTNIENGYSEKKPKIKKNITFGNVASNFQTNRQSQNISINRKKFDESDLNNSYKANSPPVRNYKRKSIFQKSKKSSSSILKQNNLNQPLSSPSQPIPIILNIKSLSDHIKKNSSPKQVMGSNSNSNFNSSSDMGAEQKILQKISTLEHIVKNIQVRFDSTTFSNMKDRKQQDLQMTNQTPLHSYHSGSQNRQTGLSCTQSQIQNNLLKLQLEQMRRCQRIAKENQILYGKLVRNIQRNQEEIRNSRRSIRNSRKIEQVYRQRQRQRQRSGSESSKKFYRTNPNITNSIDYFNFKAHKQNYPNSNANSKKITAFEDFSQTKQINKGNYLQNENQGIQVQIASPFLVEENRRNLRYSYGDM